MTGVNALVSGVWRSVTAPPDEASISGDGEPPA